MASLWAIQMFYFTTGMAMPGAAIPSPLGFISNERKCVRRQDPWVDNTFFYSSLINYILTLIPLPPYLPVPSSTFPSSFVSFKKKKKQAAPPHPGDINLTQHNNT